MKITALAYLLALSGPIAAEQRLFEYQTARAPAPGTVWHYTKSARDGSDPWHVDLYFASPTRIEVLKWLEGASDFVEVHADLDATQALATRMSQWVTMHGRRDPKLALSQAAPGAFTLNMGDQQLEIQTKPGPMQIWGFDLMAMAYLLPHLSKPERAFSVTMIDPNKPGAQGPMLIDEAVFTPVGEENIDGVLTRKYRIAGPVFGEGVGHMWVSKDSGRMERVVHSVPSSTDWPDLKLEFESESQMHGVAWERFKMGLADAQQPSKDSAAAAAQMQKAYEEGGIAAALNVATTANQQRANALLEDLDVFGHALLGSEKTQDALAVFSRATELFPEAPSAWNSLGEAQTAAGKANDARLSFDRALKLDPNASREALAAPGR